MNHPTPELFHAPGVLPWQAAFENGEAIAHRLPHRPRTCWTVSGGHDMRPLIFFSDPFRTQVAQQAGLPPGELPKPDLYLHTSLACGEDDLGLQQLQPGYRVYQDNATRVSVVAREDLRLDRTCVPYHIDPKHMHFPRDPKDHGEAEAALLRMRLTCLHTGYEEEVPLLYLAMENLNAYDAWLSKGSLDVRYLVATREGLGMGACGKSILEHLYRDGHIRRGWRQGFRPRFVATWDDYTDGLFRDSARDHHPHLRRVAPYIKERGLPFEHHFYRLGSMVSAGVTAEGVES